MGLSLPGVFVLLAVLLGTTVFPFSHIFCVLELGLW